MGKLSCCIAAALFVMVASRGFGQGTAVNLGAQSRNPDFSTFSFTRPESTGATLPATCQAGQLFFNTSAAAGQNLAICTQTNVWAALGGLAQATATTLGGVTVPANSGLTVSSGALSVVFGTAANTALQGNTLGQPNGPASLNSSGQVPASQLPAIPTKTSQLTNDAGFVTGAQASAAAPVQSVNGQTGAIVIPSYQTVQVNGTNQAQQSVVNFAAGSNVTLSGSSAGGVSTVTISASSGSGASVASGTPVPATGCTGSTNLGAMYVQTGTGGQTTWMCGYNGSAYRWIEMKSNLVNVMDFGCKADGATDDSGCFQAAINFAAQLNSGQGGTVYIPDNTYAIASPLTIPRTGITPAAIVKVMGQSQNSTHLVGLSSFPTGITGMFVTNPGSNYTGTTAGCSLSSGTGTCACQVIGGIVASCSLTSAGTTPASAAVTIGAPGSGGTQATAIAAGHAIFEWAGSGGSGRYTSSGGTITITHNLGTSNNIPVCTNDDLSGPTNIGTGAGTYSWTAGATSDSVTITSPGVAGTCWVTPGRANGQRISNLTIDSPPVVGTGAIHYAQTSPKVNNTPVEERISLEEDHVWVRGSNATNPYDTFIEADCNACAFHDITSDPSRGGNPPVKYTTVALLFDICLDYSISNEGCGLQYGSIKNVNAGAVRGGFTAGVQGRLWDSSFDTGFADGTDGSQSNASSYAFINSGQSIIRNLMMEGGGDKPQMLLSNSSSMTIEGFSCGSAYNWGAGVGDCMDLINSWGNSVRQIGSDPGKPSYQSQGVYHLMVDTNSHGNSFTQFKTPGTSSDINIVGTNNFAQWCSVNSSPSCLSGTYQTIGTVIY